MRLTVIMPVYNAMPFLAEAFNSIASQTYKGFKVVIVDDGSTDSSAAFLQSIMDDRVSIVTCATRRGQGAARNLALDGCNTEYTAFMDADDISLKDRLARQIRFLDDNRDVGVVGTKVSYIGSSQRKGFTPPLALRHDEIRRDLLRQRHALVNATMMCRTDVLHKVGGFRIDGAGEDWDLFLRITEITRAANLDEILYLYRVHRGSTTAAQARLVRMRYAHACECARSRGAGTREPTFKEFCDHELDRPLWQRWLKELDRHASAHYREGLEKNLNESPYSGYFHLALAGLLSPLRLVQRARRSLRAAR